MDVLLHLSSLEYEIMSEALGEWLIVVDWDPEMRYNPVGSVSGAAAESMINATTLLLERL